jgi:ribokinase
MREAGGLVMLDAERVKDGTLDLLPLCDVQIVSEQFGRQATGEDDPAQAARALHARYGNLAVVTAGERGSWCVGWGEAFHTPAFRVNVVDTTGAGDVFHGGFLYGLLKDWPLRHVARFASAMAALKCRSAGGRAGIPYLH